MKQIRKYPCFVTRLSGVLLIALISGISFAQFLPSVGGIQSHKFENDASITTKRDTWSTDIESQLEPTSSLVSLVLTPATQRVVAGTEFDIAIEIQTGTTPVDGAAAYLNFDQSVLQVVSITSRTTFQHTLQNTSNNTIGQIDFVQGTLSDPFPSGTFTLATVRFFASSYAPDVTITFNSDLPRYSDITKGGVSILTETLDAVVVTSNLTANDDAESAFADTPVLIDVTVNDQHVTGGAFAVIEVTQGTNGSVVNNGNGTVTYSPHEGFSGIDTFTYTIGDGTGDTATATVTVTVTQSETATYTPIATQTSTDAPTMTSTDIPTAADTATDTPTPTYTYTPTATETAIDAPTPTYTHTPTATETATDAPTMTSTDIPTAADTATDTPTPTYTHTPTATETVTNAPSPTDTHTAVDTATVTQTASDVPSPTNTSMPEATITLTPTATSGPVSDRIFADNFESGTVSSWTSNVSDGGDLSASTNAALLGQYGMQVVFDGNNKTFVMDDSPDSEPRYRMRFYFDPNSINLSGSNAHYIFVGYMDPSLQVVRLAFRLRANQYQLRAELRNDGSKWIMSKWFNLADAQHFIELDWSASLTPDSKNGSLTMWIDGVEQEKLTGIDNDTLRIEHVELGAINGIDNGVRGTYYFDEFDSRRNTYIGPVSVDSATTDIQPLPVPNYFPLLPVPSAIPTK